MALSITSSAYSNSNSKGVQDIFFYECGNNLKELKVQEGQRIKYLKFLVALLQQEKFAELILRTSSNSIEYRTLIDELLAAFSNQNESMRKFAQQLLVRIISFHKYFGEVAKQLSYITRQILLKLLQIEQGLGEFLMQNQQTGLRNKRRSLKNSKSFKDDKKQDLIEKLSLPEIIDDEDEKDQKIFGILEPALVEQMSEQNQAKQRIQTIEEIAFILARNLNIAQVSSQLNDFINFIIKYINDSNETVAAIAIQILNKVLSTINLKKSFDPKKLVPMLIKKYAEKNKRIRVETTLAFKHLLKIFRIRNFLELLVPYLQYPNFNIKQEIMNLMIYSFITSKGSGSFDTVMTIKGLASILDDKNIRVRFIALEALAYLSTIESQERILKYVSGEMSSNKHALNGLKARLKLHPRVKLNAEDHVEYPSLEENKEIMEILLDMEEDKVMLDKLSINQTQFSKSQRIIYKEKFNYNSQTSGQKTGSHFLSKQQTPLSITNCNLFTQKAEKDQFVLPKLVETKAEDILDEDQPSTQRSLAKALSKSHYHYQLQNIIIEQIKRSSNRSKKPSVFRSNDDLKSQLSNYRQPSGLANLMSRNASQKTFNPKMPLKHQDIEKSQSQILSPQFHQNV